MTTEKGKATVLADEHQQHLRKLTHEVNNCLSVVSMGMDALDAVRNDAAQFAEVHATIKKEGIEPLKENVSALLKLVAEQRA